MQEISMALRHTPEMFVDTRGYEGYEVSNLGNVWSKKTNKILKPYQTQKGYLTVGFWLNGKKKRLSIHRLVAKAFLPNPNNLPEVNHINGCKTDNRVTNLEWSSGGANVSHAYRIGLRQSKLSESEVEQILQQLEQGLTQRKLGNKFNVSHSTIGEINRGKIWRRVTA
ncbi:MAG: NUMOD4 domain-containing protein [Cyanobacteria bacterium P01_G01_bin.39]